jgi:nucleotide-binding universal stress UspA family protein
MLKRILVPLDRTATSEAVADLAAAIARGSSAEVRLMHVAPVPANVQDVQGKVVAYADQEMARVEAETQDYLRTIGVKFEGLPVAWAVRFGDPVPEILAEIEAFDADLIVLGTRCRSRVTQFVLGSVAEEVCRKARVPVTVLRVRS